MKLFFLIVLNFFLLTNNLIADNPLEKKIISAKNFIEMKFDLFFIKNKNRLITLRKMPSMIVYQNVNAKSKFNDQDELIINVKATMDKSRYKKKKYFPKNSDCNSLRNKWLTGLTGYSFFTHKRNYKVSEDDLEQVLKDEIYDIDELTNKEVSDLIEKTKIKIEILHPNKLNSISCAGKLTQITLD